MALLSLEETQGLLVMYKYMKRCARNIPAGSLNGVLSGTWGPEVPRWWAQTETKKASPEQQETLFHCRGDWVLTQVAHRNSGISLPRSIHKPVWTRSLATGSQQHYLSREVAPRDAHLETTSRGPFYPQPLHDWGKYNLKFPVIISFMSCDISLGFSSLTES